MSTVGEQQNNQRITVTETQMVLDIIANTDSVPPTEVVEKVIAIANKWRYENVAISAKGTIQTVARYMGDGGSTPREELVFTIVDENGVVPPPWSDGLIAAIKASYDEYSLDWLTGG